MKKMLTLAICLLATLGVVWAQGLETFDNFDYTDTIYIDGSFVGENGVTWNYYHVTGSVAGANDNSIDGNGMILRRSAVPSRIVSGPITGGIANFSMQMRKAYTSAGDRQLALYVNNEWVADSQIFGSPTGGDPTVHTFEVNGINIPGEITIEVRNIQGGDVNRQVTIDNLSWTAYGSGTPYAATPVFDPVGGYFTQPISVSITSATAGASIYYTTNGSNPDQSSTLYSGPISISSNTTLKARAYAAEHEPSSIATANYNFATIVSNLSQLRTQTPGTGTVFMVSGEVILTFKQTFRNQKYVQDSGAAILIDDPAGIMNTTYNVYDGITGIVGTIAEYTGMLQFTPTANAGAPTSTNNQINIPVVTIANLNQNFASLQGRLVKLNNVQFVGATGNFASGQNYNIQDPSGQIILRTQFYDADYLETPIPTGNFSVNVICLQFNTTYQVVPRFLTDFGGVSNEENEVTPVVTELLGNYPNPFNPETTIVFSTAKAEPVQIDIYNQRGQLIRSFEQVTASKGVHNLTWNGKDDKGNSVGSGVYYFRLRSGKYSNTKKMILMK